MKALASIAVIVVVLAAIVELSVASARREESRLLDEFTTATRRQAHASAEVLSARLDALDQDTRVLTDLVPIERHVKTRDGEPLTVRIRPYRTTEDKIEGDHDTVDDVGERAALDLGARVRSVEHDEIVIGAETPDDLLELHREDVAG